jgi:hypothetical protein
MNNKNNDNVEVVLEKYVKGGKEIAKYDRSTGRCWVEVVKNGETTTKKEYVILG